MNDAAGKKEKKRRANYHNDYGPQYQKPFDIYEKAKQHIKTLKKEEKSRKN